MQQKELSGLIEVGAEIASKALAEATVGYITGGKTGAVLGGLVGGAKAAWATSYKLLGKEMCERVLAPREEQRVGAVLIFANKKFQANLENGVPLRSDSYFASNAGDKPAIEENLEAILQASQKEYEERKLPYIGNLMGNIPFESEISREHANHLIKQANQLTYQQLILFSVFAQQEQVKRDIYNLSDIDYRQRGASLRPETIGILHETMELYNSGMLSCSGVSLLGLTDVNPLKMVPQGNGAHLFNLMELSSIPEPDKERVAKMF